MFSRGSRASSLACLDENLALAYVDGRAFAGERTRADRHIARCSECREFLADARRILPGSQDAPLALPPRYPVQLPLVDPRAYTREAEIGRGGLGRVIRARDERSGRIVAIKEMRVESGEAAARFVREALVTARLRHPAIVPVYEVGRWPSGRPFYAMKLVTGRPLSAAIRAPSDVGGRLGLLAHVVAAAEALAYAHAEGVIHRDLKPSNVMIGAGGDTAVIDWGLARTAGGRDAAVPPPPGTTPGHTLTGSVLGTPAYMAPEQAHGERVDERADVYAVGATLYHLLVGRPPYADLADALAPTETIERVRAGGPRSIISLAPGAPLRLVAIVERAMARSPAERYPTAAALADELRRFASAR